MNSDENTNSPNPQHNNPHSYKHHEVDESSLGFMRKLAYRRVPQAVGFYLAGSWTFLEFFESLISRYNISPHWQDVSLLVIVLLFPSILILAYRHGAPGVQPWTSVEKVGIPTNLMITLLIIFNQFATKDLGSSSEMLQGLGPDGLMIERHRPKAEFRKRLSISYFTIKDDSIDEYMALGIPLALKFDLEQDAFLNVFNPTELSYEIKQSNFRDLKVPLALMLKIAKSFRIEYLVTGNLIVKDKRLILECSLYNVDDSKLITKIKTSDHSDIFDAIDEMSVQIKSAMGLSGGHINHTTDLPITEQLTSSMPAFLAFTKSQHERAFKDNFVAEETELKKAIELDDTFAAATSQYAMLLLRQMRTVEGLEMLQIAKKHNYRLMNSNKFALAAIEALFRATPDSARNIVNQWLDLYPDEADAWQMKYMLHRNFDERLLAIESLREVIALEPFGTHRHLTIGEIYTSLGDIQSALHEYETFTSKNPTNARGHLLIGDSNRTLGNFESAEKEYQQARLLLTNDLTADRRLADLLLRTGNFLQAEQQIKNYLKSSKTPEDEYMTWQEIADLYWVRGQRKDSLRAFRNSFEALKAFQPETSYLLIRIQSSWRFAAVGEIEEGQQMIDDAKLLINANQGNIYKSNIKLSQAMFDAHIGKKTNSLNLIDEVAKSFSSYIGTGIDDNISMFKGITLYLSEDYAESAVNMAAFLKKNPINQVDMMFILADSLYESGQLSSAKQTLEKILGEYPSHPNANLGMAKIELSQENPHHALPYLEKALNGWSTADSNYQPAEEARKLSAKLESI